MIRSEVALNNVKAFMTFENLAMAGRSTQVVQSTEMLEAVRKTGS